MPSMRHSREGGRELAPAQRAPVAVRDRAADLLTRHVASLLEFRQRGARLEDRLFGCADREPERDRDLLVCEATEPAHHQSAALALGQFAQVGHQQRQPGPLGGELLGRRRRCLVGLRPAPRRVADGALSRPIRCRRSGRATGASARRAAALRAPRRHPPRRLGAHPGRRHRCSAATGSSGKAAGNSGDTGSRTPARRPRRRVWRADRPRSDRAACACWRLRGAAGAQPVCPTST